MQSQVVSGAAGALFLLSFVTGAAQAAPSRSKVDRAVRAALAAGAPSQKVIITVNPGCRATVRDGRVVHSRDIDVRASWSR